MKMIWGESQGFFFSFSTGWRLEAFCSLPQVGDSGGQSQGGQEGCVN